VVISRLTWQKGMDVLLEAIDHLVGIGGRLALLGRAMRRWKRASTRPPRASRPRRRAHRL
jgi:starch synthase